MGQVLVGMKPDDKPVEGKQNEPMMPVAWTKSYQSASGKPSRIFTTTMGGSQDLENEAFRRMLVNASLWAMGMEEKIPAKANVKLVGEYKPMPVKFGGFKPGVMPAEHELKPQTTGWHGWPADAPKPAIAPFDAEQAKKHQEEWAAYLKVPVDYTNTIGMKFRLVPPGEFLMGCPQEEIEVAIASIPTKYKERFTTSARSDPRPHRVVVTHPFYFGLNEVSQQDYLTVVGRNPSAFSTNGTPSESSAKVAGIDTSTFPVETVSWHDATVFAGIMSKSDGILELRVNHSDNGNFQRDRGYRLPTEAEYEYACRAGTQTQHWCDDRLNESAWWNGNSDARTHAVGSLAPNPFGLFDLEGNVWEWCFDAWSPDYYQQPRATPAINPIGAQPLTSQRVLRGGNYMDISDNFCRAAGRLACLEDYRGGNIGFRLTLSVEGAKAAIAKTSGKGVTTGTTP